MSDPQTAKLSRRERQFMDILWRLECATAQQVMDELDDPPTYSSVRSVLRQLVRKGHITHQEDGPRHVYRPAQPRDRARRSALKHLLHTFFDDSPEQVVTALLDVSRSALDDADLAKLGKLVQKARKEGR